MRIFCLKSNSEDNVHIVHFSCGKFSLFFCRFYILCIMIIYALMFLVCQSGERWILVVFDYYIFVSMQYWRKTYLLDLYSYRKYFILVSFKGKNANCASCTVCALPDLVFTSPILFNSTWWQSLLFFFFACVLIWSVVLCLNFNPTPYVLMPRWRVWFVPVVQRKIIVS